MSLPHSCKPVANPEAVQNRPGIIFSAVMAANFMGVAGTIPGLLSGPVNQHPPWKRKVEE